MSHEMSLKHIYPTGAELWECNECSRMFVLTWPPNYRKIVLDRGEFDIEHTGVKGGMQIKPPDVIQQDRYLDIWEEGLKGLFDE